MAKRTWKQKELELKPEEKPQPERPNYRQKFMDKFYKTKKES
jgi:hypothetical protein